MQTDMHGESTYGNLQILKKLRGSATGAIDVLGLGCLEDIITTPVGDIEAAVATCVVELGVPPKYPEMKPHRAMFCNRTLNLRGVRCVGFDVRFLFLPHSIISSTRVILCVYYGTRKLSTCKGGTHAARRIGVDHGHMDCMHATV